jgi:hypothetical protein
MDELSLFPNPMPLGKGTSSDKWPVANIVIGPMRKTSWHTSRLLLTMLLVCCGQQLATAQRIFDPLPPDSNNILFPYAMVYNNQAMAETGLRYGLWATQSAYLSEETMLVFDAYEKIPAAIRLVPNEGVLPIWNFRYWPEEQLYTWLTSHNNNSQPNKAFVCNRKFEIIKSWIISNPHEFYVMPDGLGYATLGSEDSLGISFPSIVWLSPQLDTVLHWSAADTTWGISLGNLTKSTCSFTTLDTIDGMVDYFHPNSIAAIKTDANTLKLGLYNRNVDTEFELTVHLIGNNWEINSLRQNSKQNHTGHQSDDSVWVNNAHDIQYLYADGATIIKSFWDNGGCRANPRTGYKVFAQEVADSITTYQKGLYDKMARSAGMGNGGILLQNRYASSMTEIDTGIVYGNIGGNHPLYITDTSKFLLGAWKHDNTLIFGIKQAFTFQTYRFYPYFDNQLSLDDLRPDMEISFSSDSMIVTLSLDSNYYTDVLWLDGQADLWKRSMSREAFAANEMIAYVTTNPDWFWFATKRYVASDYFETNTSINLISSEKLTIYPNPINAGKAIQLSVSMDATLYDLSGRLVNTCANCNTLLVPEGTPAGIYMIQANDGKGNVYNQKVVVY